MLVHTAVLFTSVACYNASHTLLGLFGACSQTVDVMNFFGEPAPFQRLRPQQESPHPHSHRLATRDNMDTIFQLCRDCKWHRVLDEVQRNPWIALTPMVMDNHISTTIIHQAITSKGDTAVRAEVISTILRTVPQAAAIKNGYGSLPLHVIAQRNVKMDAQTKERLIFEMVPCYPESLTEQGGVGKRTPLHIIFTGTC